MQNTIKSIISASIDLKQHILQDDICIQKIEVAVELISDAFKNGHKVLFCGNGGSAADAQHLAAEFTGRFYSDRLPLPAEALHCNTSYITSVANDYGYEYVYSRLVQGLARPGDILIGLSTSGNSTNIVKAFEVATNLGVHTIALTGSSGGILKDMSEVLINVPSSDTPRIQEAHIMIGHIICQLVEANLFPNPA